MGIQLSVVIITFNEEKNIERCLLSIQSVADEIIVVDSFSTDKTKEICHNFRINFLEHAFDGHIQQKNYAKNQATYDYVLSLDADEVLAEEAVIKIQEIKDNWDADGYYFNRLNNYCGKWIHHCGWYPDRKLRLWDRRLGEWGGENPHDRFIMDHNSTIKKLNCDILHYSFHSIDQHIQQINFFTDISSRAAFDKGEKSNLLKIIFKPIVKFLRDYILHLGILDGYYGYVICVNSAHSKFLKYTKLRELQKKN